MTGVRDQGTCLENFDDADRRQFLLGIYDIDLTPEVRRRLQDAPINLCEACLRGVYKLDVDKMLVAVRAMEERKQRVG